jgi:hypothetical protein
VITAITADSLGTSAVPDTLVPMERSTLNTPSGRPVNSCHNCGATSYRPVIGRVGGMMQATGQFQCTGCRMVFTYLDEWRFGPTG